MFLNGLQLFIYNRTFYLEIKQNNRNFKIIIFLNFN